jgi:hypothetical protein
MMGHSKTLNTAVRSHLLHSLRQVHGVAAPFTSHRELSNFAELKTIFLNQTAMF